MWRINENQLFVDHFPGETHGNHVFFLYIYVFLPVNDATIETGSNMCLDDSTYISYIGICMMNGSFNLVTDECGCGVITCLLSQVIHRIRHEMALTQHGY